MSKQLDLSEIRNNFLSTIPKDIDKLDELQASENNGRGIRCVQAMIKYLKIGDVESAQAVYHTDGDKTRGYPAVEKQIISMLGCRLHGKMNCDGWLCQ